MQAGKILGLIVGGISAVAALLLAALWLRVDADAYAPKLTAAVKDATGRELVLQGKIRLAVLPWPALKVGSASLGNPAGFIGEPFVSVRQATVRVRLLPLLEKRLEIDRLELDGVEVRLVEQGGRGNWEGLGPVPAEPGAVGAAGPSRASFGHIGGIKISHSRLTFRDYTLANLTVETGRFAADALAPVTIHVDADRGRAGETASVDGQFNLSANVGAKRYRVAALTVHGLATTAAQARPLRWGLSSPALDLDVAAQTLIAPVLDVNVAGAHVHGNLVAHGLGDAPTVSGAATLEPLIVREFLPRLGITPPWTQDPKAFALLDGSTAFAYAEHRLNLDDVHMTFDDTHVSGRAAFADADGPTLQFALAADRIDWDRYAAPDAQAARPPAAPAPPGTEPGLEVDGTLAVGELHRAPFDFTAVRVTLIDSDGIVHLYPLRAQIDGGEYSGRIDIDRRASTPTVNFDEHLTGIELGRLSQGQSMHVSGRANVSVAGTMHGTANWLTALDGHLDAHVTGGALEGVDVGFQLARAEARLRRAETPPPEDTHRTPFDALNVAADVSHGVARTTELSFSSPVLKVTGQGSVNLVGQALDFVLLADTLHSMGGVPLLIPLRVTGPVANPTVRPDLEAWVKTEVREKVDVLKDKLKGLFNR